MTWVQVPPLPLAFCVIMGKPLHPSGYHPPSCGMNANRIQRSPATQTYCNYVDGHVPSISQRHIHPFLSAAPFFPIELPGIVG